MFLAWFLQNWKYFISIFIYRDLQWHIKGDKGEKHPRGLQMGGGWALVGKLPLTRTSWRKEHHHSCVPWKKNWTFKLFLPICHNMDINFQNMCPFHISVSWSNVHINGKSVIGSQWGSGEMWAINLCGKESVPKAIPSEAHKQTSAL